MRWPFEDELRAERHRLIETLDGLSDEEFTSGATLCEGWSPRDVLGHVLFIDDVTIYMRHGVRLNAANQAMAERARGLSRETLMEAARRWADRPSLTTSVTAVLFLGDLGIHHRDIVRGLGLHREIPPKMSRAIFFEGMQLSLWLNRRVLRHRIVPSDGGRAYGRGREVRGTREAIGLWLAGRDSVIPELDFAD